MSERRTSNWVKLSPLSRVEPVMPAPTMVDTGRPGTRASANAQSIFTSMASRNPAPVTVPESVPKNGSEST